MELVRNREVSFYDADPEGYQRLVDFLEQRTIVARRYRDIVAAALPPEHRKVAVDLACGTGIITEQLACIMETVIGLDASPSMLRLARDRHLGNATFRVADFHDLTSCEDASTDVVTQLAAARYIRDDRHYAEVARILRPTGIAVTSHYDTRGRDRELLASAQRAGLRAIDRQPFPPHLARYLGRAVGFRDQHIWVLQRSDRSSV